MTRPRGPQRWEAMHLRDNRWAVRPAGCVGTCGWIDGMAWQVQYVTARSEKEAVTKAHRERQRQRAEEQVRRQEASSAATPRHAAPASGSKLNVEQSWLRDHALAWAQDYPELTKEEAEAYADWYLDRYYDTRPWPSHPDAHAEWLRERQQVRISAMALHNLLLLARAARDLGVGDPTDAVLEAELLLSTYQLRGRDGS